MHLTKQYPLWKRLNPSREEQEREIMKDLRARRLRRHFQRTRNLVQVRKILKMLEEREEKRDGQEMFDL